jgi:hypothetical protein
MRECPNIEGRNTKVWYKTIGTPQSTRPKPQPQYTRVTLLGTFGKINYRFGSLRLNLACEGLLLGMRAEGPKRFPQFSLTALTRLQKYELIVSPSFLIIFFP